MSFEAALGVGVRGAVERLFDDSVRECVHTGGARALDLAWSEQAKPGDGRKDVHAVVLNIVTYHFRIVTLFEFIRDAATAEFLADLLKGSGCPPQGQAFDDRCAEFVNRVCGAVNRRLSAQFRHSGMSTPFVLQGTCSSYLALLSPTALRVQQIEVNGGARFAINVCLCVAANAVEGFRLEHVAPAEEVAGELELF